MGPQARHEYLAQLRDRYVRAARTEKGRMLTEAVTVTGSHLKAIIRAWQRPAARRATGPRWCAGSARPGKRRAIPGRGA